MLKDLIAIREFLTSPESWTQDVVARNKFDIPVYSDSREAAKFCLLGAVQHITGVYYKAESILRLLQDITGYPDIVRWNDELHRQHEEVLDLLDKAIILQRSRQERYLSLKEPVKEQVLEDA